MPSPLVRTKLFIPPVRDGVVPRPRLLGHLGGTSSPRLTLVSAPPGFGKTTLLASWVQTRLAAGRPVAWVSLEESEQEPGAFWTHLVTAVEGASPGVGARALDLLQAPQPSVDTALTLLLNELSDRPEGLDLVLDDYHLADGPAIAGEVSFLLEHLPPQVHLVIGTRADPALPLGRLRARGELVELRAADLRFTIGEAAAYLNDSVGLGLGSGDIEALEGRTEGWIAALQLAALSLKGRADVTGFVAAFAGDDRYVVDYLVQEVLVRQPERIRRFLLGTSVLDRLTDALCDAVTRTDDGRAVLEQLDRSNLFLVPLDDTRRWYRYHHLFAEVLRAHLLDERPEEVADLHRRAAKWYAANAEPVSAVRHAVAAGDLELAADVAERSVIGLLRDRQEATARRWIDELPHDVVHRRPVLALGFIGALMSSGQLDEVPDRLAELDEVLADPPPDTVVLDPAELARLPGAMETYHAALALVRGDLASVAVHAGLAVARAAPGDDLTMSAASALSGLASWAAGDLTTAHRGYSAAVDGLRRAGNVSDVLGCSITLGDIRVTQGRLEDAVETYQSALRLAAAHQGGGALRGTADMEVGLSQVALERGELEAAATHLRRVDQLGESNGLPQNPYRWRVAQARLREAWGDPAGAVALLEDAQRVYVGDFSPNMRPVTAQRARVLLAQGRLAEALAWAQDQHLTADDDLQYVREYEHVTLARILLHQHTAEGSGEALRAAYGLLQRLLDAAEAGGRTGTSIEVLVLLALAHNARHGRHDLPGALAPLETALRRAEPERYVRVVVGEGPPMETLLASLVRKNPSWHYPRRLLDAFQPVTAPTPANEQGLVDPLSARELDVLHLLDTDLDGPAIARELVLSLNTVRTHTKSIYAKLGATSRRTALTRAGELGLLSRPR